jgi:hypothetical protein
VVLLGSNSRAIQFRQRAGNPAPLVDIAFTLITGRGKGLIVRHPLAIKLGQTEGWVMTHHTEIAIGNKHLRAIREEIGGRLRQLLDRTSTDPSPQLRSLLLRFEQAERIESPSIVPSAGDMEIFQRV